MMRARQKVVARRVEEQNVFALAQGATHTAFEVFRFTGNKLSDRESFLTEGCQPDPEARSEFLRQYYAIRDRVPPLVVLDGEVAVSYTHLVCSRLVSASFSKMAGWAPSV